MIDRYRLVRTGGPLRRYAVFLGFVLAPFVEGFLVSLKPLSQLFSSPYSFLPKNGSFDAYFTMWEHVPGFLRYILNSFFISGVATAARAGARRAGRLCPGALPVPRQRGRCWGRSSPSTCSRAPSC